MAKRIWNLLRIAFAAACLLLTACGGGGHGGTQSPPPPTGIGAAGGTASGPQGASVNVPAGALASLTNIQVAQSSSGAPALPAGFTALGAMYAFTPHGTQFAIPVTITLPFDPASVPAGATPALFKTNAQAQWEPVTGATFGATTVSAQITSFSFAQVLIPPLTRDDPTRTWSFGGFPGNGAAEIYFGGGTQVGGLLEQTVDFGMGLSDIDIIGLTTTLPAEGKARGYVFGTENGVTYGAYAEAPFAAIGGAEPVGSISRLTQSQSFIKRRADATLRFTFTKVLLSSGDYNLFAPSVGFADTTVSAQVFVDVEAYTPTNRSFFHAAGGALISGHRALWNFDTWTYPFATTPLWSDAKFQFLREDIAGMGAAHCAGDRATLTLREPLPFTVDLSSIAVGDEFTLRSEIFASATNRRGGGSEGDCEASASVAYLRDPLEVGGATIEHSGLEPTNRPVLTPPPPAVVEPAACSPGPAPDPDAGVLQFRSAAFAVGEYTRAVPTIAVTRTGGSRGAVTATFATGSGTASATADYTPVEATVFFADGDDATRIIEVPIAADALDEADESVNLSLTRIGGCAALGSQNTAVLTIVDDDLPPPTGLPGALDATFDADGKASLRAFGGDRSAMALQADGKIVMAGGTFVDFVLARFNADGSVDASFDADGRVTTDMVNGEQEEALAVAVQPDGKIVVAGYTGTAGPGGPRIALARYQSNGSLDPTFGTGGKIVNPVEGIAYAIAIQPDGRIVVAGEQPRANGNDFADFVVARYDATGAPDPTFSGDGVVVTDIGGGTNTARNLVLQPDGAIVVSGEPIGTFTGSDHTDVARYTGNGSLDATFGSAGVLTLPGARVGEGLALQAGKLILAGSIATNVANQFSVRRLLANGAPDTGFGEGGVANTAFTDLGDMALAVALQSDGKIVVAGRSSVATNSNFAVARLLADGDIDTTFANAGKQTVDFFGSSDIAESVVVAPDGKIVLGGLARDSVDGYGLVRVNP